MKINKLNLILVFRREELLLIQHDAGIYSTTDLEDSSQSQLSLLCMSICADPERILIVRRDQIYC